MKPRSLLFVAALLFAGLPRIVWAQSTAFTYQGRLIDSGQPAAGIYDLTFTLFPASSGSSPVGSAITNLSVGATNGLFLAQLDFGAAPFNGGDRWLEIAVRTNGATFFATLSPRQKLEPTPYALAAASLTGPVAAGQLTGNLPAALLAGPLTLTNVSNTISGNGLGLTNLPGSAVSGLGSMAYQSTNSPAFNSALNQGWFTIQTNTNFLFGGIMLNPGGNATEFWNQFHPGDGEYQITSTGSMSLNVGYDMQHNSVLQIGSSLNSAELINFQWDWLPSASSPLGYSKLVQWVSRYWSNNFAQFSTVGVRGEAIDTNGHAELKFYNPTPDASILFGQSPGTEIFAITPYGTRTSGNSLRALGSVINAGSNFVVDVTGPDFIEAEIFTNIAFSVTNIHLTNLTSVKDIYLNPGPAAWNLQFPVDWVWESDSGAISAPTSIPPGVIMHVHLTINCALRPNYYARYTLAPNITTPIDPDAANFWTTAGLTNVAVRAAIDEFVLDAKFHGYWSNLVAIYPFVGGNSNLCSYNLINPANYRINWSGTVTFSPTGVAGDGLTGYGTTGLDPSLAMPGTQNSSFVGVWVRGPSTPSNGGYLYSCTGNNSNLWGIYRDGILAAPTGLNNSDNGYIEVNVQSIFNGFFGQNRTGFTNEADYFNSSSGNFAIPRDPTLGLPSGQPVTFLANYQNSASAFSSAALSGGFIGANMTSQNITDLVADWTAFNTALGR